tara:strand:- start:34 stop:267 length:234 start_codon:yes stop_codon:yes gene_type:complete
MTYNVIKKMKNTKTGKIMKVLLLDGLSSVLEIQELDKALNMAMILNHNSDNNCYYEVRGSGKTYDKELAILTHKSKE